MRHSGYVLMLLFHVAALAVPALILVVCGVDATGGAGARAEGDRGSCLLAACSAGPGIICQKIF